MKESASSFSKGRTRRLSAEELALWLAVARTVSPRPSRRPPKVADTAETPIAKRPPDGETKSARPKGGRSKDEVRSIDQIDTVLNQSNVLAATKAAPKSDRAGAGRSASPHRAPAPLERKLRQKLARGRATPDAAIDLHGLRRQEAHAVLRQFLPQAQREGARLVLVVTGKGRGMETGQSEDQTAGILRRSVPQWLREPEFHAVVVGFEEASRPRGGAGALYVRLRRQRPGPA